MGAFSSALPSHAHQGIASIPEEMQKLRRMQLGGWQRLSSKRKVRLKTTCVAQSSSLARWCERSDLVEWMSRARRYD